jgi:hypothetical protein
MIWLVALASAQSGVAYPSVQIRVQGTDPAHTAAAEHAVITARRDLWGCFSKGRFEVPEPDARPPRRS